VAVSTRDTVTFGFGLEQVDQATREALVAKAFGYLLPSAVDSTAPSATFTYPAELTPVTAVDPVDIEVKAFDERGDIKEVRLYAGNALVTAKRSFPFQFRYYPTSSQVGSTLTLRAEAEDKAGNVKTITRDVRVVTAEAIAQTPIAVGLPILTGTPTVGSTLTITNIAFLNTPTSTRYVWLRDGDAIAGADRNTYALTAADLGHQIRAQVFAGNADGEGDATTKAPGLFVSAAAGATGPKGDTGATGAPGAKGDTGATGQPGTNGTNGTNGANGAKGDKGDKGDKGETPNVRVTCDLSSDGRSVVCTISAIPPTTKSAKLKGTVRLSGTKSTRSFSGKGSVKVRLKSAKRLKRAPKVVIKVTSGAKPKSRTVTAR
jgi:hypothetical protein